MRYGLNSLFNELGAYIPSNENRRTINNADELKKILELNLDNPRAAKEILNRLKNHFLENTSKIAHHLGNLYDYPMRLVFDLKIAIPNLNIIQFNSETKPLEKTQEKMHEEIRLQDSYINKFFKNYFYDCNIIIDHLKNEVTIVRIQLDSLKKTMNNHMKFITVAYSSLINENMFSIIIKKFISEIVLEKLEWGKNTNISPDDLSDTLDNNSANTKPSVNLINLRG